MILKRIKSEGIAHNSYLVSSGSDAVVIDLRRDCQVYADYAQQRGLTIRYVFETHRNEDYVVGSIELKILPGRKSTTAPALTGITELR